MTYINSIALTRSQLTVLRRAVADYLQTEGCSCCEGEEHNEHRAQLAKLLDIPKYKDGSGYNFDLFATDPKQIT